ncbi:MAG: hypothetical protein V7785_13455 [Bermanella sp.]
MLKFTQCLLLYWLCASACLADINILSIAIPGLHQSNEQGAYDKIINQLEYSEETFQLTVVPPARAKAQFLLCKNCCISPTNMNPNFYDYKPAMVETLPMNIAKIYVFSARNTQAISGGVNAIRNKRVGVRRGLPYGKRFAEAGLNLDIADSLKQNFGKLERNRVDVVVAYIPDAYIFFDEIDTRSYPHAIDYPLAIHNDSLVCRGVSNDFIQAFNYHIKHYHASGKLKRILGKAYVPP